MTEAQTISARGRVKARYAADILARADYELGCAGEVLERGGLAEWQAEADALMRRCIDLRSRIVSALDG